MVNVKGKLKDPDMKYAAELYSDLVSIDHGEHSLYELALCVTYRYDQNLQGSNNEIITIQDFIEMYRSLGGPEGYL